MNEVIDFGKSILEIQSEIRDKFSPAIVAREFISRKESNDYMERQVRGLPFLTASDIDIDWDLFNFGLQRLNLLCKHRIEKPVKIKAIQSQEEKQVLIHNMLNRDSTNSMNSTNESSTSRGSRVFKGGGVSPLPLIIQLAFTPFMEKYANLLIEAERKSRLPRSGGGSGGRKYYKETNWLRGICPICGRDPFIAKIEPETGKRYLHCCLCRTEWAFKRIGCPFCGNIEQKKLRFFYVDENSPYRVDVCDECKKYIKTVDTRKSEDRGQKTENRKQKTENRKPIKDRVLFIDYVTTTYLDKLAQDEGFYSPDTGLLEL
ncbi:MAG: formate dehydrogenase accessory protein FdhE [Candidatus Stahlbacteria bacterium]|nr:formate dehydrogenase accessory protein FdhE [Candidatus Stahlbacteria bacterium]